ncbi:protein kinase domain-containing protein [Streptomyces sparsus]
MGLRESARAVTSRCSVDVLAGRYRLDRLLGSGGAADVHQGFDLRMKRPVAVKVFRYGSRVDVEEDAQREATLLARLRHPGLVTAFDAGQDNGRAFLVMELIDGMTLRERIAQGVLSAGEAAALGAGLARALGHAHEAGIIHRDVKPSNVLLDSSMRPHLTDFGISRLLDTTFRTSTGVLVGTAGYLSPEQVMGRPVGRPSDIYALGLVILECLTGRPEYDGGPLETAIARLHRPPTLPPDLPRRLRLLLADMTALDEHARPDADACARALAALADTAVPHDGPPRATARPAADPAPPRTADRTHRKPPPASGAPAPVAVPPVRKRALLVGTVAALSTVLAGALAVTGSPAQPDHADTAPRITGPPAEEDSDLAGEAGRQDTARTSGSPTAGSPAAGSPTAGSPPADARKAGAPTAGSSPAGLSGSPRPSAPRPQDTPPTGNAATPGTAGNDRPAASSGTRPLSDRPQTSPVTHPGRGQEKRAERAGKPKKAKGKGEAKAEAKGRGKAKDQRVSGY